MISFIRIRRMFLSASAFAVICSLAPTIAHADTPPAVERDGQRDFDFNIGTWKTHVSRLEHPLTGSHVWAEYDGTSLVRTVWSGQANLFELDVTGPAGHIRGVGLRLYNSKTHRWSLNWANTDDGAITGPPAFGRFKDGFGEFADEETLNGKTIRISNRFFDITPNSSRFEQAFSADGGKTWEVNWKMTFERVAAQ
jgi:hypothetical protein